jgi:SpoIID/LytB domain protein
MPMTMPSSRRLARPAHPLVAALLVLVLIVSSAWLAAPSALADRAARPASGSFTLRGAGFGHGWGMSQYGAYGAAVRGLDWRQILAFYYPGTRRSTLAQRTIRVWVTADTDGDLRVRPASGLTITSGGTSYRLPAGSTYRAWQISRSGSGYRLRYLTTSGAWKTERTSLGTGTWRVSTSAGIVTVLMPDGSRREYRGTVSLVKRGATGRTVNTVSMENYVRAVLPTEMPTSWALDAVRAQAVAARTYAAKLRSRAGAGSGYDICDTPSCQVYPGYAVTSRGKRTVHETSRGNAAVKATANVILTYRGAIALTQFSSSNGGASARGDYPYLTAHPDPFDRVITAQRWSRKITAAAVGRAWGLGTVRTIQVTARDGSGPWGGRVRTIKISDSKRSMIISGASFASAFGLRSTLFNLGSSGASPSTAQPAPSGRYAAFPHSYETSGRPNLLVIAADGTVRRYPIGTSGLGRPITMGAGFDAYRNVVNAGDWDGDGHQDLVTRSPDRKLRLLRTGTTGPATGVPMGSTLAYSSLTGVGDLDGDSFPDLVALTTEHTLWLLRGDGATGRRSAVRLATGWKTQDLVRGVGDLTGDAIPDLVARIGDRLYLYPGSRTGLKARRSLGTGWSAYASITSVGDVNRDGRADLVARTTRGALVLFLGGPGGTLRAGTTIATGFAGTRFAT